MTNSPLVSVVIPAYNASRFLAETIESVLGQTYTHWEMIVVDDGSTDDTPSVVERFLSDSRIRYLPQENGGVSVARNQGLRQVRGEFVTFLDADDVWLPNNLLFKVDYLERNPDCGIVHSDIEIIDLESRRTGEVVWGKEGFLLRSLLSWDGLNIPAPSHVLMRRSLADAVGGFDPAFSTAADQDFNFRVARHTSVGRIALVLSLYRVHPGAMHLNIVLMERDHIGVYQKARASGLFDGFWLRQQSFSNLYLILAGSWWRHAGRKGRAAYFIARAIAAYPPCIARLGVKAPWSLFSSERRALLRDGEQPFVD